MDVVTKDELKVHQYRYFEIIRTGKLFIHPTDTIYGIGCDATSDEAVAALRSVKSRYKRPFSIIAPSTEWIREHCNVNAKVTEWLDKLPGPYTLILKLKKNHPLAHQTNLGLDTVGVRIPDHWFSDVVKEIGKPVITTSANLAGDDYMTQIEDLNPDIKAKMAFIAYEGPKEGKPSTVVDLTQETEKILRQ